LGALLIACFLVLITPLMHAFWRETDEMQRLNQMVNFTKNTALLGGCPRALLRLEPAAG
jgi:putative oxidoreductase